jgi:hypothetical protein
MWRCSIAGPPTDGALNPVGHRAGIPPGWFGVRIEDIVTVTETAVAG